MQEFVCLLSKGDKIVSLDNRISGVIQDIDANHEYETGCIKVKIDGGWEKLPSTDMVFIKNLINEKKEINKKTV